MDLSGHRIITRAAIDELMRRMGGDKRGFATQQMQTHTAPPGGGTGKGQGRLVGPDFFAVQRDMIDVTNFGHWLDHAQKHHFMRRKDEQTPVQAWHASCGWVESNLQQFADAVARGFGHQTLQALGNACHAVEDSFSRSHVSRAPFGPNEPGLITHIHVYAQQHGGEHSHADSEWERLPWVLALATAAVVDLVALAFDEVQATRGGTVRRLNGWTAYRDRWLKASPDLPRLGAHHIDLIDAHTNGPSLDEKGLAHSLFTDLGTKTDLVGRVFSRLDKYDNTNADDVARYYVAVLRRNLASAETRAVAREPALVAQLIRILDSGMVSSQDAACVAFLRQLR